MGKKGYFAQSTVEYALLAVAIALSAVIFFRNFDRVQGIFKNHVKEASGVIADSQLPPLLIYAGGRTGYPYLNMGYHYGIFKSSKAAYLADTTTAASHVTVPAWVPQPINPLIAPYMSMVYGYAQQYLNKAVTSGEISSEVAQYAMQALAGYLNVPEGEDAETYLASFSDGLSSWVMSNLGMSTPTASDTGASLGLKQTISRAFKMWGLKAD